MEYKFYVELGLFGNNLKLFIKEKKTKQKYSSQHKINTPINTRLIDHMRVSNFLLNDYVLRYKRILYYCLVHIIVCSFLTMREKTLNLNDHVDHGKLSCWSWKTIVLIIVSDCVVQCKWSSLKASNLIIVLIMLNDLVNHTKWSY